MTYRETLQWLAENWNGEFGEKCNVEIGINGGSKWLPMCESYPFEFVMSRTYLRLTRAEVERRTGRKVIEWREPKYGDWYYADIGICHRIAAETWRDGPRWILGDKLYTASVDPAKPNCDKTVITEVGDKLDAPDPGIEAVSGNVLGPCKKPIHLSREDELEVRIQLLEQRVEELEGRTVRK